MVFNDFLQKEFQMWKKLINKLEGSLFYMSFVYIKDIQTKILKSYKKLF